MNKCGDLSNHLGPWQELAMKPSKKTGNNAQEEIQEEIECLQNRILAEFMEQSSAPGGCTAAHVAIHSKNMVFLKQMLLTEGVWLSRKENTGRSAEAFLTIFGTEGNPYSTCPQEYAEILACPRMPNRGGRLQLNRFMHTHVKEINTGV